MVFNNAVDAKQTGIQALDATGQWNGRTLTAGTGISISNGDGIAANPTISFTGGTATTSWTPNIQFGGAQVGITYGNQTGWYTQLGDTVFYQFNIVLTSKGTSVGAATISNLPVAAGASNLGTAGLLQINVITLPVGTTYATTGVQGAGTSLSLFAFGTTVSGMVLDNASFANNSQIVGAGFYTIS